MTKVAELVHHAVGEAHAAELLTQWAGFGRFCRELPAFEPLAVMRAFGLGHDDPEAEVLAGYPEARADEAKAAEIAGEWGQSWRRRFGPLSG